METNLLKDLLNQVCVDTYCHNSEIEENVHVFTMINGSDSVKLVFNLLKNEWYIEVFPINQNDKIETIVFSNKDEAIKAFKVWQNYYLMVVKENFRMF